MAHERIKPTVTKSSDATTENGERLTHPAFGSISITRVIGGHNHLFGSKLRHNNTVNIQIQSAVLDRDLYSERHYGRGTVCELMLSETQWAHIVASVGIGGGTACTFRMKPADGYTLMDVPGIEPDETMSETHRRNIEEKCNSYVAEGRKLVKDIKELVDAGKANKGQLAALHKKLDLFTDQFANNMGFAQEVFAEAMEKTVSAGKTEIEAFVTNLAVRTGIEALQNGGVVQLIENESEKAK